MITTHSDNLMGMLGAQRLAIFCAIKRMKMDRVAFVSVNWSNPLDTACTVTQSVPPPRKGNHGPWFNASWFSHNAMVNFLGPPMVVLSVPPNCARPQFCKTSFTARPMVALARLFWPLPRAPCLKFRWLAWAIRLLPLMISIGVAPIVVACTPCKLKAGSNMARTAAITMVKWQGWQPARMELMATLATVHVAKMGGILPNTVDGGRSVPVSIHLNRSSVGGTMGKPSDMFWSNR